MFYDDTADEQAKMISFTRPRSVAAQSKKSMQVQTYISMLDKTTNDQSPNTTKGARMILKD